MIKTEMAKEITVYRYYDLVRLSFSNASTISRNIKANTPDKLTPIRKFIWYLELYLPKSEAQARIDYQPITFNAPNIWFMISKRKNPNLLVMKLDINGHNENAIIIPINDTNIYSLILILSWMNIMISAARIQDTKIISWVIYIRFLVSLNYMTQ